MLPALIAIALGSPVHIGGARQEATPPQTLDRAEQRHQADLRGDEKEGERDVKEIAKQLIIVNDPIEQARVDRIGNELADIANHTHAVALWGDKRLNPFHYDFHIVLDKDPKHADIVNAFSIPGGHIYVFKALLRFCESDDELAGILGHEIAHAAFRHVATLEKNANKIQLAQIPLILAGILAGGGGAAAAILGSQLGGTAAINGWSVQAEKAADYGGFQFLLKSHYDPTGMLTAMERLAQMERDQPYGFELGILRDHPPGRERAESLIKYMNQAGRPIRRSRVATSYRTEARPQDNGQVQLLFGTRPLVTLAGKDAMDRANVAAQRLNDFFDSVPDAYEVQVGDDGAILRGRRPLIDLTADDATAAKVPLADLQSKAITHIRAALFTMGSRVWDETR